MIFLLLFQPSDAFDRNEQVLGLAGNHFPKRSLELQTTHQQATLRQG